MLQSIRKKEILSIAKREKKVSVEGLAQHFGVTHQTIRRDLSELSNSKKLERVHGGAVLPSGTINIGYNDRRHLNDHAKRSIARRCAQEIPYGSSVFLNIGTSTEAVAQELLDHRELMIVTNNMNVANILAENPKCQVVVSGGALRRTDGGLIGKITTDAISNFKFDIAVIGCSALDLDGDLLDFDIEEVSVSQAIIAQSRRTFLVADHSKFNRTAPARIASLAEIDSFFTDHPISKPISSLCAKWKTKVIIEG